MRTKNSTIIKKAQRLSGIALSILILSGSCTKVLEVEMAAGSITEENVFLERTTSIAAVTNIMTGLASSSGVIMGSNGISIQCGLAADELTLASGLTGSTTDRFNAYHTNSLSSINLPVAGSETWAPFYSTIYKCNAAIKGLNASKSTELTPALKKQLIGEAIFLRAFCYFYLTNLFGDVPLVTSTNLGENLTLKRAPKSDIYSFVISELLNAKQQLSSEFQNGTINGSTTERVRPTKWAAAALLSRAYLYNGDFGNAELQADEVIAQNAMFDLTAINSVFLKNSKEAIWQLQPVAQFFNTADATLFVMTSTGPNNNQPVYLSSFLLSAFESGDARRTNGNWVRSQVVGTTTYQSPFKYKLSASDQNITPATGTQNMGEYLMVFRLAELYLIRAEARAQQNKLAGAISDLDKIRGRANLPLTANANPGINQTALIDAILKERRVEFFTEMGHRWLDLKRRGKIDEVMTVVTPQKSLGLVTWHSYQQLFPVPQTDISKSPNLTQNPGYE